MTNKKEIKVALVTDSLFKMAGGARVLEAFAEIFPNSDIYTLFTCSKKRRAEKLSKSINTHRIITSKLNSLPFVEKYYRYTLPFWPFEIEKFDFSSYDLVISSSWAVSHGVITPLDTFHLAYIHTPMRYIWDMYELYFKKRFFKGIYSRVIHFLRIWDVSASSRPNIVVSNSNFVAKRIFKYWRRKVDEVIFPSVNLYEGEIVTDREEYFVSGAPYEPNKGGDFLFECAKWIGFNLKVIGSGGMMKKYKKRYSDCKNISFESWVSEEEKFDLLSHAKGYILMGIEEYGIFPAEALSCGTPVFAFSQGGILDTVKDGENGILLENRTIEEFKNKLDEFSNHVWDYNSISKNLKNINSKEDFKRKIKKLLVDKGLDI
jgi:glycosyltransferase involved in cell wall biosynthesis